MGELTRVRIRPKQIRKGDRLLQLSQADDWYWIALENAATIGDKVVVDVRYSDGGRGTRTWTAADERIDFVVGRSDLDTALWSREQSKLFDEYLQALEDEVEAISVASSLEERCRDMGIDDEDIQKARMTVGQP